MMIVTPTIFSEYEREGYVLFWTGRQEFSVSSGGSTDSFFPSSILVPKPPDSLAGS